MEMRMWREGLQNRSEFMSAAKDVKFQEANKDSVFIEGMDVGVQNSNKKSGRKSIKKTKKVARQKGVGGLGTSEKGAFDVYKVFNDEENGTNKPFVFSSTGRVESDSKSCSINMEQIISINIRDISEAGKKDWIKSIINVEQPDIIVSSDNSGGIIMIWDARSFTYKGGLGDERFVAVRGEWKGKARDVHLTCIYGPHVGRQKASLWNRISGLMDNLNGAWCIFGDLNMVRGHDERMNSQINIKETCEFNDFINEAKLIKIPMGEKIYKIVALDQKLLDHYLIVLKDACGGKKHGRWKDKEIGGRDCRFRDKLKNVKAALKKWSKERFGLVNEKIERFKNEMMKKEVEAEKITFSESKQVAWMEARKSWMDKENKLKCMLRQKARIKGLTVNGLWCEDPSSIKAEMEDASLMEKDLSEGEILDAVRGCGGDKAPGPDDFNFKYIRKFWDILKSDLIIAIRPQGL
ncbi:RNA-directed DNA polymerase, eukaryota [Tanacetum coccineum]